MFARASVYCDTVRACECPLPAQNFDPSLFEGEFQPTAQTGNHFLLPRHDARPVDARTFDLDAEGGAVARMGVELCAVEEGFRRYTADIEAGASYLGFFDEDHLQLLCSEALGGQIAPGASP